MFKANLTTILGVTASAASAWATTAITPANFGSDVVIAGTGEYNIVSSIKLGPNGTVADTEYVLEGFTFVMPGVTLEIEPGVIVRGQPAPAETDIPGSLLVTRGGEIYAVGTATNPIIFTTANVGTLASPVRWTGTDSWLDAAPKTAPLAPVVGGEPAVNQWGALTLLGYAPNNRDNSDTGVSGEAFIEGYGLTDSRVTYGGRNPNDSSGSVKYVSIRHSGRSISEGDEQQGLTLGSVGMGTELDYIDIYCSGDDGIEIFGGTATLKHFMLSYFNDDGLDVDQGWTGYAQYGFILAGGVADPSNLTTADSCGEWDGEDGSNTVSGSPFAHPTMYNLTMFGPGSSGTLDTAFIICKAAFGGDLYNSILFDGPSSIPGMTILPGANSVSVGLSYPNPDAQAQVGAGTLNFAGLLFVDVADNSAATIGAEAISQTVAGASGTTPDAAPGGAPGCYGNRIGSTATSVNDPFFGLISGAGANDQTVANGVNPVPLTSTTAGSGATLVPYTNTFFTDTNHIGAFPENASSTLFTTFWTAMNIRGILVDNGNGDTL
ncbi:hypothetical protein [Cerasicoccus maritimus]|uniref:hypothetical protein n=1 Tax=Cerasicoccus maritimus TaxID=490089 RepID=UPI002852BD2A|nr:hypothetical protein [Cerasicoccus maritimus]